MNRTEQKIESLRQRIRTGRTKEIILLEQLIELKAENAELLEENNMQKERVKKAADLERKSEKKPMSRIDIIGSNGGDGAHYAELDAMPPADNSLLASANLMMAERLAGIAHALRGNGIPALADIDDGEDLQQHVAALTGAYQMAIAERDLCRELRDKKIPVPSSNSTKDSAFQRYACMIGIGETYQDVTSAQSAAEYALEKLPIGKTVAVVAIIAQAENVLAPLWKDVARDA